jgi:hypothetical protein
LLGGIEESHKESVNRVCALAKDSKQVPSKYGLIIAQDANCRFSTAAAGFDPMPIHMGFVVDKVTMGQVSYEYFGFLYQFSFHQLLHTHPSAGADTMYQVDSVTHHLRKLSKKTLEYLFRAHPLF